MASSSPTGLQERTLVPELLDGLPAEDPRAIRSRGDLRRVNALMFQASIAAGLLRRHCATPPRRWLEIGGGDGAFALAVAKRLAPRWRGVEVVLLDRLDLVSPATRAAFREIGWRVSPLQADIFAWVEEGGGPTVDCVCANLFLHHFTDPELAQLFAGLMRAAPLLLATEPRRSALALGASRLLWAIGANDVTRHDAPASVRAGFAGNELTQLWTGAGGIAREERKAGLFSHVFAGRGAQ